MNTTEARPIKGFNNYIATSDGEIYIAKTGKSLKPEAYLRLQKDGIRYTKRRIYWLAITFIPNPANLPHVQRIDGNVRNNKVENLRWSINKK